nr:hypothetical protein [Brevundimonas diminuta]
MASRSRDPLTRISPIDFAEIRLGLLKAAARMTEGQLAELADMLHDERRQLTHSRFSDDIYAVQSQGGA